MSKIIDFDYKIWKAHPEYEVKTKEGHKVSLLHDTTGVTSDHLYPLKGYLEGIQEEWTASGQYYKGESSDSDLVLVIPLRRFTTEVFVSRKSGCIVGTAATSIGDALAKESHIYQPLDVTLEEVEPSIWAVAVEDEDECAD